MKQRPESYVELEENVCSNSEHAINQTIVERLKNEDSWSTYPGWDFCSYVWHEGNQYHAEIWCYKSHVETLSADTFEELKEEICCEYGSE